MIERTPPCLPSQPKSGLPPVSSVCFARDKLFAVKLLLSLLLVFLPAIGFAETVTYRDDFKRSSAEDVLNASETTTGKAEWTASASLKVASEGGKSAVVATQPDNFRGYLALPGSFKKVTIEADVHPQVKEGGDTDNNWVGIMIGEPNAPHPTWQNALMLLLETSGNYQAMAMYPEPGSALKSGNAAGFDREGMNRLKIEYDKVANTVSMFVNKALVVDERSVEGLAIAPNFVGFGGYNQTENTPTLSNFSVTVEK